MRGSRTFDAPAVPGAQLCNLERLGASARGEAGERPGAPLSVWMPSSHAASLTTTMIIGSSLAR